MPAANSTSAERLTPDILLEATFEGPSALLTPDGVLLCGTRADELLRQQERAPQGGLVIVHSHRQQDEEFELHARMLRLASHAAPRLLHKLSVLIVNNNAASVLRWSKDSTVARPLNWLRPYGTLPSIGLRMLVYITVLVCLAQ